MKLYHGTSVKAARQAITEGLKPRAMTGNNNWEHGVESNPSMVYLTKVYAPYYAIQAAGSTDAHIGIIEIDTEAKDKDGEPYLGKHLFRPDEDYISFSARFQNDPRIPVNDTHSEARRQWIRDNLRKFRNNWKESLRDLGNCCYEGTISPESITRVTIADMEEVSYMVGCASNATITEMHYLLMGNKYKMITDWFNKKPVTITEWVSACFQINEGADIDEASAIRIEAWKNPQLQKHILDQSGLEVIFERQ